MANIQPTASDIRNSNRALPPLTRVTSRQRLNTQNPSDTESERGPTILKPKPKRGFQPAEFIKAVDYFMKQAYTLKGKNQNNETEYRFYKLFSQTSLLQEYGLGIYLYLEFIKRLAITFLIMSGLTIVPVAYAYMRGTSLQSYKSSYTIELARSSIGNLQDGNLYGYLIFTASDLLSMVALFCFYLHWRSFHEQAVTKQTKDVNLLNPSHYTLSVNGFDPTTPNLQTNIQKYITNLITRKFTQKQQHSMMGYQIQQTLTNPKKKIYQIQIMYNFHCCFSKFIEYDELLEEKQKENQLINQNLSRSVDKKIKIDKKIAQLEEQLSKISQVFEPIEAIIHFENIKARFDFINFQRRYSLFDNFSSSFKRFICCSPLPPRDKLFMQTQPLLITSLNLSRPQQINWQNLDISAVSRVIRWIVSIIFLIISIAITSSAIALCTLYVSSSSACTNFDETTTLEQAQLLGGQNLFCYCSVHFTEIYTDPDVESACQSISNTILFTNIMQVGASLVSSVSNVILITAVSLISRYLLKPASRPIQYSFIFVGVLLSNYINASILPLVMNGDIFGFESLTYLKFINFIDFQRVAVFKDYTTDWYAVVAPYYMNFLIIACVSPIINLLVSCLFDAFTKWRVKKACENNKQEPIIQKQANKMLTGFEFDLATQKAIICLNFFISVMYSSLMPILIPITTLYLIISFFCKKFIILRYSVRVPADAALSQKTMNLIPFVILLHFMMGIWAHTADGVFDNSSYVIKFDLSFVADTSIIIQRAFKDILMLGGGALIACWIIFDNTLVKFFVFVKDCFKADIEIPKQLASSENKSYQDELKSKNILGSYKLVNNPTHGHAMKAYQQFKRRQQRQRQQMRKTFNNTNTQLRQQEVTPQHQQMSNPLRTQIQQTPQRNHRMEADFSPEKDQSPQRLFGRQTMDSLNAKSGIQLQPINTQLNRALNRYERQQKLQE